jgi:hypothetical protein
MIDGGMQRKPAIFALAALASLAYWKFESISLRRRVNKLSVPLAISARVRVSQPRSSTRCIFGGNPPDDILGDPKTLSFCARRASNSQFSLP